MRIIFSSLSVPKDKARLLRIELIRLGFDRTLSDCRTALARIYGYASWNELARITGRPGTEPTPLNEATDASLRTDDRVATALSVPKSVAAAALVRVAPGLLPNGSKARRQASVDAFRAILAENAASRIPLCAMDRDGSLWVLPLEDVEKSLAGGVPLDPAAGRLVAGLDLETLRREIAWRPCGTRLVDTFDLDTSFGRLAIRVRSAESLDLIDGIEVGPPRVGFTYPLKRSPIFVEEMRLASQGELDRALTRRKGVVVVCGRDWHGVHEAVEAIRETLRRSGDRPRSLREPAATDGLLVHCSWSDEELSLGRFGDTCRDALAQGGQAVLGLPGISARQAADLSYAALSPDADVSILDIDTDDGRDDPYRTWPSRWHDGRREMNRWKNLEWAPPGSWVGPWGDPPASVRGSTPRQNRTVPRVCQACSLDASEAWMTPEQRSRLTREFGGAMARLRFASPAGCLACSGRGVDVLLAVAPDYGLVDPAKGGIENEVDDIRTYVAQGHVDGRWWLAWSDAGKRPPEGFARRAGRVTDDPGTIRPTRDAA